LVLTAGLAYELAKTASTYGTPIAFVKTKGELDVESKIFHEDKSLMEAQGELIDEFNGEVDGRHLNTLFFEHAPRAQLFGKSLKLEIVLPLSLQKACNTT